MTIYDIAKEAGVSGSTVSRVINNRPGINAETRKRVQAVLAKYDYSPDEAARGLVSRNSGMIGILVSDIRNLHYIEGAYIIEEKMLESGYCSIILNTGDDSGGRAGYIKLLASRRVKGAVLIGSSFGTPDIEAAIQLHLPSVPVVIANGRLDLPNAYSVVADERGGVHEAASYLLKKGRKDIIYLDGLDTPSNAEKRCGYIAAMEEAGRACRVVGTDGTYHGALSVFASILDSGERVDGVIAAVDIIAMGAERAAYDRALRMPDDISIIGIDNSPYAELSTPRLSSLDTKLSQLSTACADTLLAVLGGREAERVSIIRPSLVIRET